MALNIAKAFAVLRSARTGAAVSTTVGRRAFHLLTAEQQKDATLPQFMVGTDNGFLPRQVRDVSMTVSYTPPVLCLPRKASRTVNQASAEFAAMFLISFCSPQLPLVELPKEYEAMEQLLQDMPIVKADGSHGLLHHGTFGDELLNRLPQYDVSKVTDSVCTQPIHRIACHVWTVQVVQSNCRLAHTPLLETSCCTFFAAAAPPCRPLPRLHLPRVLVPPGAVRPEVPQGE
jgi:hypothetical protein